MVLPLIAAAVANPEVDALAVGALTGAAAWIAARYNEAENGSDWIQNRYDFGAITRFVKKRQNFVESFYDAGTAEGVVPRPKTPPRGLMGGAAGAVAGASAGAVIGKKLRGWVRDGVIPSDVVNAREATRTMAISLTDIFRGASRLSGDINNLMSINVHGIHAGTSNAGAANYWTGAYLFNVINCSPTTRDIQSIDDFFSAYGYRVDRFMTPKIDFSKNIGNNQCFYLKVGESCCKSSIREAQLQFDAMCKAGTRFWKTEIGTTQQQIEAENERNLSGKAV